MFPTIHLPKMALLLSLTFIIATGSLLHSAPLPYTVASLTLTAPSTNAQPLNTYSVSINFSTVPPSSIPVTEVHFGAYESSTGVLTSLLVQKPTVLASPGWNSSVIGTSMAGYRLKFTPTIHSPTSLAFTFQSADTITTLRSFSTAANIPPATWVTNAAITSGTTGSFLYTNLVVVPPLPMTFTNNSGADQAWVTFETSQTTSFHAFYIDSDNAVQTIGSSLTSSGDAIFSTPVSVTHSQTIYLNSIDSGVAYIFLGANPAPITAVPSAVTSPQLWSAACEITYVGNPADSGDLTQINCFSFPMNALVTTTEPNVTQSAQFNEGFTADDIVNSLVVGTNTVPPLTTRQDLVTINSPGTATVSPSVLRILTPGQLPNPGLNGQFSICGYASFAPYMQSLVAHAPTIITGSVTDASGTLYTYNYKLTTVANAAKTIFSIELDGYYVNDSTQNRTTCNFTLPGDDAANNTYPLSWFLYGSPDNLSFPQCPMVTTASSPDPGALNQVVLAQILHDMEAGFNLGFVGSTTPDEENKTKTYPAGTPFGLESSQQWFADTQKMAPDDVPTYSLLQPLYPYYNAYSAFISESSTRSIYGSAYSDAVPGVTLNAVAVTTGTPPDTTQVAVTGWSLTIGAASNFVPNLKQSIAFPSTFVANPVKGTTLALPYYSQTMVRGNMQSTGIPIQWTLDPNAQGAITASLTPSGTKGITTGWLLSYNAYGPGTLVGTAGGTLQYQSANTITKGFTVSQPTPVITLTKIPEQTYHLSGSWTYQIQATLTNAPKGAVIAYTLSDQNPGPNGPGGKSMGTVATISSTGLLTFTQTGNFTVNLNYKGINGAPSAIEVVQGVVVQSYSPPGTPTITLPHIPIQTVGRTYTVVPQLQNLPANPLLKYTVTTVSGGGAATVTSAGVMTFTHAGVVQLDVSYAGTLPGSNTYYPPTNQTEGVVINPAP